MSTATVFPAKADADAAPPIHVHGRRLLRRRRSAHPHPRPRSSRCRLPHLGPWHRPELGSTSRRPARRTTATADAAASHPEVHRHHQSHRQNHSGVPRIDAAITSHRAVARQVLRSSLATNTQQCYLTLPGLIPTWRLQS